MVLSVRQLMNYWSSSGRFLQQSKSAKYGTVDIKCGKRLMRLDMNSDSDTAQMWTQTRTGIDSEVHAHLCLSTLTALNVKNEGSISFMLWSGTAGLGW